jgi:L-amino acid N-acyltransferase YncA
METLIEPCVEADWPAIRSIYLEGIATGIATFETEAPAWKTWDAAHLAKPRLKVVAVGAIAAWAALSPVSSAPAWDSSPRARDLEPRRGYTDFRWIR